MLMPNTPLEDVKQVKKEGKLKCLRRLRDKIDRATGCKADYPNGYVQQTRSTAIYCQEACWHVSIWWASLLPYRLVIFGPT